MKYAVVVELTEHNLSAYVPDLPGCVATGRSHAEVAKNIREAIQFHIEGLREDGLPVPPASSSCAYVDIERKNRLSQLIDRILFLIRRAKAHDPADDDPQRRAG